MANVAISNMSVTWNNAGTTFTAIKMNATDTASAAGSMLMDLQKGGVSQFKVDKNGVATMLSNPVLTGGTANGVLYLDGSKVATSGSVFRFDGTNVLLADGTQIRSPDNFSIFDTSSSIQRFNWSTSNTYATRTGGAHVFNIAAGEQMRLNSTGLGIGTSNPGARLDVNGGDAFFGNTANTVQNIVLRRNGVTVGSIGTYNSQLEFTGGATLGQSHMVLTSAGNVGIGTSSPGAKLHVNTGGNTTAGGILLQNAGNQQHFWYLSSNTVSAFEIGSSNGQWTWTNSNGERMRLNTRGDLGIGGVTPPSLNGVSGLVSNYLNVIGGSGLYLSSNAYYEGAWKYYGTGAAAEYELVGAEHRWKIASVSGSAGGTISFTQAMTLDASGRLGIGVTSTTARLEVYQSANNLIRIGSAATSTAGISIAGNGNTHGTTGVEIFQDSSNNLNISTIAANPIRFSTNNTIRASIPDVGGMVVGAAALATNATNGFLYVPTCAGTPTGTPTTQTGTAPIVVDTTNNKLYFYSGGAWRDAGP